jgi:hypothetical protein
MAIYPSSVLTCFIASETCRLSYDSGIQSLGTWLSSVYGIPIKTTADHALSALHSIYAFDTESLFTWSSSVYGMLAGVSFTPFLK